MPQVLACLTQEHDTHLVVLAGIVCLLACYAVFNLMSRGAAAERPRDRWCWLTAAAVVAGCGVWAIHFVMMLPMPDQVVAPAWLTVAVAAVTLTFIVLSLAGAVFDRQLAMRTLQETEQLRRRVAELEETKRELETTGANLRRALDAAAASNRAKPQFLATVSHELRTPLNSVIGFAELLGIEIHGELGDRRYRDYAASIRDSGAHLLALINDVLDFAKIDAGRLELAEDEIDVPELFAASLRMVKSAADEAGLALHEVLADAELPRLRGDQRRVKQILLNLLSNAIKFTPGPGVVTIAARRQGDTVVISVADTGIGIAPEDLEKALEPFGQIDNRLARAYEGTGLGLPLSKQLMEVHGGSLRLDSQPEVGTTVWLTFPAERTMPLDRSGDGSVAYPAAA